MPTQGLGNPEAQRASASSTSSPRKRPQQSDYPLLADNKTGNRPMNGDQGPGAAPVPPTSETRLEAPAPGDSGGPGRASKATKRRKNRHRKRRNRHQSFITPGPEDSHDRSEGPSGTGGARESMGGNRPTSKDNPSFFNLGRNLSNTSLESDALLDHRYATFSLREHRLLEMFVSNPSARIGINR